MARHMLFWRTTSSTSSSVTASRTSVLWLLPAPPFSASSSSPCATSASSSGIRSYFSSPAFSYSPSRSAASSARRADSRSALAVLIFRSDSFSSSHVAVIFPTSSSSTSMSRLISAFRRVATASDSRRSASASTRKRISDRSRSSIASGFDSCCSFSRDACSHTQPALLSNA